MTELRRNTIETADSASIDAFGRWRVSNPSTLFDSKQLHDNQPLIFDDQEISGSGTGSSHSTNTASSVLSVTASTAGKRVRQTFMRFNYQPGKSLQILLTGVLEKSGVGQAGIVRGFGYYDDNNGIFLQDNEGVLQIVRRSNTTGTPVDTAIDQSNWNLDKLDGTGPSGATLDATTSQILYIDLEWLGTGRVRIGFVINGLVVYSHEFLHANVISGVYMSTPNLPIRYEIENDGTGGEAQLEHICSSVVSEGGQDKNGVLRHVKSSLLSNLDGDNNYVMQGIKLKSTHIDTTIDILTASIIATTSNDEAHWYVAMGGTLTGGSLTFTGLANSSIEYATGDGVIQHSGGTTFDGGFVSNTNTFRQQIVNAVRLGSSILGTPQTIYLVLTPITNNTIMQTAITWRELI